MDVTKLEEAMELGAWLGRRQAFSGLAGRCSAADANCLLKIREEKKYKALGLTWEEFCGQRLGISRALADKTIRLMEEFGDAYFHLNGSLRIAPEDYRLIAGSVSGDGVQYGGEVIPIAPQNAVKLAEAVGNLKQKALPAPAAARKSKDPLWQAAKRLQAAVTEMEQLLADGPGQHDRATLMIVLGGSVRRLDRLNGNLRA
jgi:hypothetical protein